MKERDNLTAVFLALSDPTRRAILASLADRERTVSEIAEPFAISSPAISRHLKALEKASLIIREVRGREHHCRLNPHALSLAYDWLGYYRRFYRLSDS